MLVLGRKENETILIGNNIRVTIVSRSGTSIRIGIEAPDDVKVLRGELVSGTADRMQRLEHHAEASRAR